MKMINIDDIEISREEIDQIGCPKYMKSEKEGWGNFILKEDTEKTFNDARCVRLAKFFKAIGVPVQYIERNEGHVNSLHYSYLESATKFLREKEVIQHVIDGSKIYIEVGEDHRPALRKQIETPIEELQFQNKYGEWIRVKNVPSINRLGYGYEYYIDCSTGKVNQTLFGKEKEYYFKYVLSPLVTKEKCTYTPEDRRDCAEYNYKYPESLPKPPVANPFNFKIKIVETEISIRVKKDRAIKRLNNLEAKVEGKQEIHRFQRILPSDMLKNTFSEIIEEIEELREYLDLPKKDYTSYLRNIPSNPKPYNNKKSGDSYNLSEIFKYPNHFKHRSGYNNPTLLSGRPRPLVKVK